MPRLRNQSWRAPFNYLHLLIENISYLSINTLGNSYYSSLESHIKSFEYLNSANILNIVTYRIIYLLNLIAIILFLLKSSQNRSPKQLFVHIIFLILIILTAIVLIITNHSYNLERYLFFISPLFIILISLGILNYPKSRLKTILVLIIITSFTLGLIKQYKTISRDSDHRPLISSISKNYNKDSAIILEPFGIDHMYRYYLRDYKFFNIKDTSLFNNYEKFWVVIDYRSPFYKKFKEGIPESLKSKLKRHWEYDKVKLLYLERNSLK